MDKSSIMAGGQFGPAFGVASDQEIASGKYLREHSTGSVLRSAVRIYGTHFKPIFLCYILPTFPLLVVQTLAEAAKASGIVATAALLGAVVSLFATGAITITISDICLGNAPSVKRSYGRVFKGWLWLKLIGTSLLYVLLVLVGLILLVVPGFVLMIKSIFLSEIVVLERVSGLKALKRSSSLIKGFFWRTTGVFTLLILLMYGVMSCAVLLLMMAAWVFAVLGATGGPEILIAGLFAALIQGMVYPVFFAALILLYYDLRVRKEAYDVPKLEEDLMR